MFCHIICCISSYVNCFNSLAFSRTRIKAVLLELWTLLVVRVHRISLECTVWTCCSDMVFFYQLLFGASRCGSTSIAIHRKSLQFLYFAAADMKQSILRGFKTSDDAFPLSYSIAFDCSIRPFLDLFKSWLYIFHLYRFSGDGLVSFLQVSSP